MSGLAKYTLFHNPAEEQWVLKREGAEHAYKRYPSKATAITALPELFGEGSPASVRIQRLDGALEEERTYPRSMDPRGSRG